VLNINMEASGTDTILLFTMQTQGSGGTLGTRKGYHLNIADIHIESGVVYVIRGKGYKERFVPVSKKGMEYITTYLYDARPLLITDNKEEAFF